jgi:hypothetical protein
MASSFSTDLKLELMVTGENAGTWGTKTNTNLNLIQQAIAGYQAVSIAGGAQTTALAMTDATISNARNAVIEFTGTITGNQVVTIPDGVEKTYIIINSTVGAFTVQFKTVSGTGFTFATDEKSTKVLYSNGTNIIDSTILSNASVSTLTNKTITARVVVIADASSITINGDTTDIATQANTQAVGTLTINAPSGTPVNGQRILLRLRSTNVQTFSFNAIFTGSDDLSLPTTSSGATKYDYMGFVYNSTATKWQLVGKVFGF